MILFLPVNQLNLSHDKLPTWVGFVYLKIEKKTFCYDKVQQYLHLKQNSPPKTTNSNELKTEIEYYKLPFGVDQITFVDSESTYERLETRLFANPNEELIIGLDCKMICFS